MEEFLTARRRAGEGLGGGDGAAEEIEAAAGLGRRWILSAAARVGEGEGEDVGGKGAAAGVLGRFYRARRGEGVMAGQWPSMDDGGGRF
jgi:hypothetical protein